MAQSYLGIPLGTGEPVTLGNKKIKLFLLAGTSLAFIFYMTYLLTAMGKPTVAKWEPLPVQKPPVLNSPPPIGTRVDSVATVVTKALYFKSLLTTAQQTTLQQTYTTTLARKWSNLPCGSGCRNGIQCSTLNATQLAAALDVIKAASGTSANEGYNEFMQIRYADTYLRTIGGGTGYDSSIYFISFLNTPSTSAGWMLQFGGHHYAANFAYNGGKVVGITPYHMGVEPTTFTLNSVTYSPLTQEHDAFTAMLASLTTAQLTTARLSSTFSDCVMLPGESNGGPATFPAKAGLLSNVLTTTQKSLVIAAMKNYTNDLDDSTAAVIQALFESKIDSIYIGWTGSGTSGSPTTFLNANTNYIRLDGPRVWIEFVCQNGVVVQGQIHYHTVFRDRFNDYGKDLTSTSLPLDVLSFAATTQDKKKIISWTTANEQNVSHFEVERSANNRTGSYASIGTVVAKNNASNTYTFEDDNAVTENVYYYRLKVVDKDGAIKYSKIVSVRNNGIKAVTVSPNPATNQVTISLSEELKNGTVLVTNSAGKTVLKTNSRTGTKIEMNISALPAGAYFIRIEDNGSIETTRFIRHAN